MTTLASRSIAELQSDLGETERALGDLADSMREAVTMSDAKRSEQQALRAKMEAECVRLAAELAR